MKDQVQANYFIFHKDTSKCGQLYYPARTVGTYPDVHQDTEISVPSGFAVRLGISRRKLNLLKLFFIPCQYRNVSIFHGERSVSYVLSPDECQLLSLNNISSDLQVTSDLLHSALVFEKGLIKCSDLRYLPGDRGIFLEWRNRKFNQPLS